MSLITVVVIPADIDKLIRRIEIEATDLEAYQAIVGGYIEGVSLYFPDASLYCNEEGKLRGLPYNHRATTLASGHNEAFNAGSDVIVGDVLITGPVDAEGYDTSAPDRLLGFAR